MNKILKNLFGGLVLILILIVFYLLTFQISHKRLVVKETTAIISIGDLNSKKTKSYYELYKKATGKDFEDIKQYTKYVKGIDIISYNESTPEYEEKDKEVMAINIGWLYPIAKFKQSEYFDDLGKNYFSLKEIYQKELSEKYGIENKIYMTNYKGYYFISDDVMKLSDYMRLLVKKESNENITSKLKGDTIGEVIVDFEGVIEGASALKVDLDYKKNNIILNGYVYGDLDFSECFEGLDPKERKLVNYMGKDRIYFTNKDFKKLTKYVKVNISPEIESILSLVKVFTGKELEDYMGQIDGELVYDYKSDQLILPLKETKDIENLLGAFSEKNGNQYILGNEKIVEIEENTLYYNGKMLEGDIKPGKDNFFESSINLGIYNQTLDGVYVEIAGKIDEKKLNIIATLKEEDFLKVYKRMEENKDD